jgi:hypothetical protein
MKGSIVDRDGTHTADWTKDRRLLTGGIGNGSRCRGAVTAEIARMSSEEVNHKRLLRIEDQRVKPENTNTRTSTIHEETERQNVQRSRREIRTISRTESLPTTTQERIQSGGGHLRCRTKRECKETTRLHVISH